MTCCAVLSGTPCLICERAEEARTGAVCFTPAGEGAEAAEEAAAGAARRSGSWWTLRPRTSQNTRTPATHTEVGPLPAATLSVRCCCLLCAPSVCGQVVFFLSDEKRKKMKERHWVRK